MSDVDRVIQEYLENGNDFGFTNGETDIQNKLSNLKDIENSVSKKLKDIENLVMPFYVNLMNAEGDIIKWPQDKRKKQIKDQIEKLLKLTR